MEQNIILRKKAKYGYTTITLTPAQFEKHKDEYIGKGKRWHIVNPATGADLD